MKTMLSLFIFLLGNLCLSAQYPIQYVYCGAMLNVESGDLEKGVTIVVNGDRIAGIIQGHPEPPEDVEAVDLKNMTVLPGLIDMHVHLEFQLDRNSYAEQFSLEDSDRAYRSVGYAEATLRAGFTTVRDLGGSGVSISLRDAIASGLLPGPRVLTAGKTLSVTGGHGDPTNGLRRSLQPQEAGPSVGIANGSAECQQAVRVQVQRGANCIEVAATGDLLSVTRNAFAPHFTEEELQAIVETAEDYGLPISAPAHGAEGIKRAARAGVNSIEHATMMDQEAIDLLRQYGTWYVPTLMVGEAVRDSAVVPGFFPPLVVPKALFVGPNMRNTFARAHEAGVKIAFGTGAGVFQHGLNAIEFELMVGLGMEELEAIRTATLHGSMLLGMEGEVGVIKRGAYADLVAVQGNPLQNISLLQNIRFVMKGGQVYKHL